MNRTDTPALVAESYLAECETIAQYGVAVLDPAQAAELAASAGGAFILDRMRTFAWDLKSNDRQVTSSATQLAAAASQVVDAVGNHHRVHGSVGGETWTTSYARDLQKAVDARQNNIDQLVQFTYAAKQVLGLEGGGVA